MKCKDAIKTCVCVFCRKTSRYVIQWEQNQIAPQCFNLWIYDPTINLYSTGHYLLHVHRMQSSVDRGRHSATVCVECGAGWRSGDTSGSFPQFKVDTTPWVFAKPGIHLWRNHSVQLFKNHFLCRYWNNLADLNLQGCNMIQMQKNNLRANIPSTLNLHLDVVRRGAGDGSLDALEDFNIV